MGRCLARSKRSTSDEETIRKSRTILWERIDREKDGLARVRCRTRWAEKIGV